MLAVELALIVVGLLGHTIIWVAVVNRIHAFAIPRWLIEGVTLVSFAVLAGAPLLIAAEYLVNGWTQPPVSASRLACIVYLATGLFAVFVWGAARLVFRVGDNRGLPLLSNHTQVVDLAEKHGGPLVSRGFPALYARLPRNEVFSVQIHHEQLSIPRLPSPLEGLRIAHISDLHMSGRVTRPFFEDVVQMTNDLDADLIAVTGDLFDRQRCFEWIDATYARLSAPLGVYFVFGNHDDRVDTKEAVRLLEQAGLVYLGGRWNLLTVRQWPVVLAGNELPWFPPSPDLSACPTAVAGQRTLRVLLSHSPDQLQWARSHDFDLMLCGHNHGGQIRFPLVGAVFAPSNYGTRFDQGTFQHGNTVLHVSRGTGTHTPMRFNCPPEIALLELRSAVPS